MGCGAASDQADSQERCPDKKASRGLGHGRRQVVTNDIHSSKVYCRHRVHYARADEGIEGVVRTAGPIPGIASARVEKFKQGGAGIDGKLDAAAVGQTPSARPCIAKKIVEDVARSAADAAVAWGSPSFR